MISKEAIIYLLGGVQRINIIECPYNKTKMSTIKTAVRVRPFLPSQIQQHYRNTRLALNMDRKEITIKDENTSQKKAFRFDYLLPQECDQDEVFAHCGVDQMISKALEGYHSTIFAYGQTGSGKTFTMQGEESPSEAGNLNGIIPKVARSLFQKVGKLKAARSYIISVSFLQIYSEKIYDLLNPSSLNNKNVSIMNPAQIEGLRLRWSKDQQFTVENLFLFECKNEDELLRHFRTGLKNRINATHKLNLQSSRSHSILSIRIQSFDLTDPSHLRSSRIELVDLAGSQRLSMTGTQGKLAKQSIDINKSLFTLRQVINILSQNANPKLKKQERVYVPYRDSKLTSILKQSIGGNSYCLMIACINPNDMFLQENISTLTYATKASFITNRPVVNDDPRMKAIMDLKRQVHQLTEQLDKANKHIEFLSAVNDKIEANNAPKSPKKLETPDKIKKVQEKIEQHELPAPTFKKGGGSWDSSISERLIESINMVRELLKSNKQLREKLEEAKRCIDERDVQIFQLTKENQQFKQGATPSETTLVPISKPPSTQSKRLTFKISSSLPKQALLTQEPREMPIRNMMAPEISLNLNKVYMNEKGIDSTPTNFNKRLTSTSQDRRASYSRGSNVAEQDRHAITAKFSKRGWLGRQIEGNKFLSFYEDIRS